MELGGDDHPTLGRTIQQQTELEKIHPRKSFCLRRTHSVTRSPPRSTDQPQPGNQPQSTSQPQIQYRDVWLKDRTCIGILKPFGPNNQAQEDKSGGTLGQKQDQTTLTVSTTEPQGEIWGQELSLPAPSIEWGHMVNQLNQDPWAELIADSRCGTAAMEGSEANAVGDEEVEGKDEGATAGAAPEAGVANLTSDP